MRKNNRKELKPCPFCGRKAKMDQAKSMYGKARGRIHFVRCGKDSCCYGPERKRESTAAKIWNQRYDNNREERIKALIDQTTFGTGAVRIMDDGSVKHIPLDQIPEIEKSIQDVTGIPKEYLGVDDDK